MAADLTRGMQKVRKMTEQEREIATLRARAAAAEGKAGQLMAENGRLNAALSDELTELDVRRGVNCPHCKVARDG